MKVVVASDSFKGSLTSREIGEIFQTAAREAGLCIDIIPVSIADGGEGTLDALLTSGGFSLRRAECLNPLFEPIEGCYGIKGDTALIEMAKASGLTLIEYADGNALKTTTYGTGQLIADAIGQGATHIIVTAGGSATNDGGIGALNALGFEFLDGDGNPVTPCGESLVDIKSVVKELPHTDGIEFTILTDVDNPLVGECGATRFYGKQKGAVGEISDMLEEGMENFAQVAYEFTGNDIRMAKGAGAAGGLAGGLMAFLGAKIQSGIDGILSIIDFENIISDADAIITGEGKLDAQSLHGKAVSGVCKAAKKHGVPVFVIAGIAELSKDETVAAGIEKVCTLSKFAPDIESSIKNAKEYAKCAAQELLASIAQRGSK